MKWYSEMLAQLPLLTDVECGAYLVKFVVQLILTTAIPYPFVTNILSVALRVYITRFPFSYILILFNI